MTAAKTDSLISKVAMDVKRVTVILWDHSTAHVTCVRVSASADQESSACAAILAQSISTDSLTMVARSASAIRSDLSHFNVMILTVSVDAETTSKDDDAIGARRKNATVRMVVKNARLVII